MQILGQQSSAIDLFNCHSRFASGQPSSATGYLSQGVMGFFLVMSTLVHD